jgi:hypothetical protein
MPIVHVVPSVTRSSTWQLNAWLFLLCTVFGGKDSLPDRAPVRLTFTLTFELFALSTHSSAAPGANQIQNAGYNVSIPWNCRTANELHMAPRKKISSRLSHSGVQKVQRLTLIRRLSKELHRNWCVHFPFQNARRSLLFFVQVRNGDYINRNGFRQRSITVIHGNVPRAAVAFAVLPPPIYHSAA